MAVAIILLSMLALAISSPVSDSIKVYPVSEYKPTTTTTTTTTTRRPYKPSPIQPRAPSFSGDRGMTAAMVLERSPFTCNGLKDGHYADVHFQCQFFHQCQFFRKSDGLLYVQQAVFECGEGTRFNQTTLTCDYSNEVTCTAAVVKSIIDYQLTAPTPAPGRGGAVKLPQTSFVCNPYEHQQGFYYADLQVGCTMYHRCIYHVSEDIMYATEYSFMCGAGTIFDMGTASCQDEKEYQCTGANADEQAYLHPSY